MGIDRLVAGLPFWLISCCVLVAQNDSRIENRGGGRMGVRTASRPALGDQEQAVRPLYLTGTVVLQGGGPLPSMPRIELKCNGSVRKSVRASPDGRFTIALGTNAPKASSMDASLGGPTISSGGISLSSQRDTDPYRRAGVGSNMGFGRVDLSGCLCEADLPGYRSQPITLGIRSVFDSSDIGKLTLYPSGKIRGTTISLNSLNAPKNAKEALRKAEKELGKDKVHYPKVEKHLRKAVQIYPEYAEAWQTLGEIQLLQSKETEARQAFRSAITADPEFVTPYLALGELEIHANQWEKAAQFMSQAAELNPYLTPAHYFYAVAKYFLRQDAEAEDAILKVQQSEDAHLYPASHYLLGGIYEDRGDLQAAALELRRFLKTDPPEHLASEVETKIGNWEAEGLIRPEPEVSSND